jgi:ethanolamine utilization protein EutN
MKLARVVGTVVSTIHVPAIQGRKQLLCDLLDPHGQPTGSYVLALDTVGAGEGELVLVLDEGSGARQILGDPRAPIRALVVGVVDEVAIPSQ